MDAAETAGSAGVALAARLRAREPAATGCTIWFATAAGEGLDASVATGSGGAARRALLCGAGPSRRPLSVGRRRCCSTALPCSTRSGSNIEAGQAWAVSASRRSDARGRGSTLRLHQCRRLRPGPPSRRPASGSIGSRSALAACRRTRRPARRGQRARQSGHRLGGPRRAAQGDRALRAAPRDRARDRRPARRGQRAGQSGHRLGGPRRGRARRSSFHEQHLAIAREIGDRRGEGNALGNLGNAWAEPRRGRARRSSYYEQQLAIAREIGDRRGEGNALGNLGVAWAASRRAAKAIELLRAATSRSRARSATGAAPGHTRCGISALRARRRSANAPAGAAIRAREFAAFCIGRWRTRSRRRWRRGSAKGASIRTTVGRNSP